MSELPTLSDGVPPLTQRQHVRLSEWLDEVNGRSETQHHPHQLAWDVRNELRPGRGHDVTAVAIDADYIHSLMMDPYGNGSDSWGTLFWAHSSAYEECDCEPCEKERQDDD